MTEPPAGAGRRVALVTGAGRGIGRAIATRLAAAGTAVVLVGRDGSALEAVGREIRDAGGEALPVAGDIVSPETPGRIEEAVLAAWPGGVDILVNNAGVTRDGLLFRMREEDWSEVLDTNLGGCFRMTKTFAKGMTRKRWGRIINITSVIGVIGNAGQANYAASKAGIIGFTKSIARELASRQVTANAVAPGFIETSMTGGLPEKTRQGMMDRIPLGRFGSPEDVAGTVVFLASDAAAYLTGQVLAVDGGMIM